MDTTRAGDKAMTTVAMDKATTTVAMDKVMDRVTEIMTTVATITRDMAKEAGEITIKDMETKDMEIMAVMIRVSCFIVKWENGNHNQKFTAVVIHGQNFVSLKT